MPLTRLLPIKVSYRSRAVMLTGDSDKPSARNKCGLMESFRFRGKQDRPFARSFPLRCPVDRDAHFYLTFR